MNLFETATRNKYRYNYKGLISVEDLWDLSLEKLDAIFKELNSKLKEEKEESLLDTKTKEKEKLENKVKIIKYIVETKQKEKRKREKQKENKAKRQRIMKIIREKKDKQLENKNVDELEEMLDDLGE